MRIYISLAVCSTIFVAGCQTQDPYTGEEKTSHTTRGATMGAVGGAIIGALTNTSSGKQAARNALIGAGVGALAGGAVGHYMDEQEARLRSQLRNAGVSVRRVGNSIELDMRSDILFDLGSDYVKPEFVPSLEAVGLVLDEYNQTIIEVNGFTDTTGSAELNDDLSERRARAVAEVLVREGGVMPERIVPQGFGESELAVQTGDGVNEPRNRRVQIRISPYTS